MTCSCADGEWKPAEPRELARMTTLVKFWRANGCCWLCALGFALAEVEKEAGRAFPKPRSCEKCRASAVACYHLKPPPANR